MKILVIHGPNLNMLGKRDPNHYGAFTLEHIYEELSVNHFPDIDFTFFQSNHEGELIDIIQKAYDEDYHAILINPGAYSHTSIAIRDALEILKIPIVEVHLSDVDHREDFRKVDYIKDVCIKRFMGKKIDSYLEAIQYLLTLED